MDINTEFDKFLNERKKEIHNATISFMCTVLKLPNDVYTKNIWNNTAIDEIIIAAENTLTSLKIEFGNPYYLVDDHKNIPCFRGDLCKNSKCPFKK